MVSIVKRTKGNNEYYYLRHHIRQKNREKEIYLGQGIPKDIEQRKRAFLIEFYREDWIPKLDKIHKNYTKNIKRLPPSVLKKELGTFSVAFTFNTQRIEGSTLTLRETADLLEEKRTPKDKPVADVIEAEAHQRIFLEMLQKKEDLSLQTVLKWNENLLRGTESDIAGKIRDYDVRIRGSKFNPPAAVAVRPLLDGFFKWYKSNKNKLNAAELAALAHLKFVTIHPFGNGNGRVSRLVMNSVLYNHNYPMLDIDYKDRTTYYKALERAQINDNEVVFLQWFMKRYLKANSRYL